METKLYDKTLCMDFRAAIGTQYDTHNLYGWAEALPSLWLVGFENALFLLDELVNMFFAIGQREQCINY